jgi:multiple sugar transport system substrate-binding protein
MFTRHGHTRAAALLLLALPLAACGGGDPTADAEAVGDVADSDLQGVTITVGDFFGDCIDAVGDKTDLSGAQTECETMRILNNKFNAENDLGITVNREGGAEWSSYYDAVNASFAAKSPPDILLMHQSNIPDYSSRGLLLPLEDMAEKVGVDLTDVTEPAQGAATIDEHWYAVPFDEHANLVHLNMDLMKKADLVADDGSPVLPTSPEELKQQAKQFQDATGKQYIAWANDFNVPYRILSSLVSQQGTDLVTDDGEVQVDSDAAKQALNLIADLYSSGIADPKQSYDASQQAWLKGDVGMLVNGTWVVNEYNKSASFDYQATDFPTLYEGPGVWANSHTWVIPVQDEPDPVKYRAAMEYAAFMFEHDGDWARGSGHLSVRPSVLGSDDYQAAPQRATYVDTADNAALVPQVVGWQGAEDALQQAIESVWLSGNSVDQALAEAQSAVEKQLD